MKFEFSLTADEKRCAYCTYRSLCNRGVSAGSLSDLWDESDDEVGLSLDFEQSQRSNCSVAMPLQALPLPPASATPNLQFLIRCS